MVLIHVRISDDLDVEFRRKCWMPRELGREH